MLFLDLLSVRFVRVFSHTLFWVLFLFLFVIDCIHRRLISFGLI